MTLLCYILIEAIASWCVKSSACVSVVSTELMRNDGDGADSEQ